MKKVFIAVAILTVSCLVYSQTKDPQISFEKAVHDFGTVKEESGKVSYQFKFINTGGSPLLVENVTTSCGCTAPEWTRHPIPPGGSGSVTATFNPAGRPGKFSKYLYISSNTVPASTKLTITGDVTPKPKTLEDDYRYGMGALRLKANHLAFGNINNTDTKDYKLEIVNNSDKKITLGFDRIPKHIDIRFEPEVLKPMEKGYIIAQYDAAQKGDWGMLIDRINVLVDGKTERNFRLIVSANIIEDFSSLSEEELASAPVVSVMDTEVSFGQMKQGEKFEHVFVLKNEGKSTLYIRKIKSSCGCTAVQPQKKEIAPGESVDLRTVFNSAGKRGSQNKTVTIITNDPKRSNLVLRIKGEVLVAEA